MIAETNDVLAGPNSEVVRRALSKEMHQTFSIGDTLPNGDSVTVLSHVERAVQPPVQWVTMLFCSEDKVQIRSYVTLQEIDGKSVDRLKLLESINLVNYHYMLDGMLDYNEQASRLRLRETFRADNPRLQADAFINFLRLQMTNALFWSLAFRHMFESQGPVDESALRRATAIAAAELKRIIALRTTSM